MMVDTRRTAAMTAALTAAVILGAGGADPARAQNAADDDTAERLLACDGIADMTEKLACFDSVVQGLKEAPAVPEAEPATAAATDTAPPPDTAPAPPAAAASTTSSAAPVAAVAAPAAVPATTAPSPAAPAATAVPETTAGEAASLPDVTPAATPDTPVDPIDEFGRDSMQGDAMEAEETGKEEAKDEKLTVTMHATVVRSWINNDGRFSVELDNGQIWRETAGSQTRFQGDNDLVFGAPRSSKGRLPKAGNTVEISEGRMSGYRMKIQGIRQAAWVRRTQ